MYISFYDIDHSMYYYVYLPNYLSLWNNVDTTCWKLVRKVKNGKKKNIKTWSHYIPLDVLRCISQSFLDVSPGRVGSESARKEFTTTAWNGNGPMNESQTATAAV